MTAIKNNWLIFDALVRPIVRTKLCQFTERNLHVGFYCWKKVNTWKKNVPKLKMQRGLNWYGISPGGQFGARCFPLEFPGFPAYEMSDQVWHHNSHFLHMKWALLTHKKGHCEQKTLGLSWLAGSLRTLIGFQAFNVLCDIHVFCVSLNSIRNLSLAQNIFIVNCMA